MVRLPDKIGLCPVHAEEFYYPLIADEHAEGEPTCPACSAPLVIYDRTGVTALSCPQCGGPMTFNPELDAHVCSHPEDSVSDS